MEKHDFEQLVKSIKEMKQIQRGKLSPVRLNKFDPVSVKLIRRKLRQSQTEFAFMIGVSPSTLRNWEQNRREPTGPAKALLRAINNDPQHVLAALAS